MCQTEQKLTSVQSKSPAIPTLSSGPWHSLPAGNASPTRLVMGRAGARTPEWLPWLCSYHLAMAGDLVWFLLTVTCWAVLCWVAPSCLIVCDLSAVFSTLFVEQTLRCSPRKLSRVGSEWASTACPVRVHKQSLMSELWDNKPSMVGYASHLPVAHFDIIESNQLTGASLVAHGEEFACNGGNAGSVFHPGRSPGEGKGSPLQYSCLGKPKVIGDWWAMLRGVARAGHNLGTKPPPPPANN